MDDPQNVE